MLKYLLACCMLAGSLQAEDGDILIRSKEGHTFTTMTIDGHEYVVLIIDHSPACWCDKDEQFLL